MYNQAPESGLASLLASRGRNGDSMLVHMAPEEVAGLRQVALAHGGDLYRNPRTGLYEASFLKKILPQIIGAVLPSVPGLGNFAKTIGMGNQALGSALLVGGASALIEGDLKKGLMAGLGAYSGASIGAGLKAAAGVEPTSQVTTEAPGAVAPSITTANREMRAAAGIDTSKIPTMDSMRPGATAVAPINADQIVKTVTQRPQFSELLSTAGRGVKNIFTTPEGGSKFMEGLGGGYKSPIGQMLSRYATFSGAMIPFTEQPQAFPTGGIGGDEIVYIPGAYDPSQSTVFQSRGQYYRRNAQGQLIPYNPYAPAPRPRGFATGGPVQPADQNMNQSRSLPHQGMGIPQPNQNFPLANVMGTPYSNMQSSGAPQSREIIGNYEPDVDTYTGEQRFADGGAVALDPNVAAVRAYIEDLNRRAREGLGITGAPTGGAGAFGPQYLPPPSPAGNIMGGGGGAAGPSTADILGGIATSYLTNKAVDAGIGYLKDKFLGEPTLSAADAAAQADAMGIKYGVDTPESLKRSADIIEAAKAVPLSSMDPLAGVDLQGDAGISAAGIKTPVTATQGYLDPVTGQYVQGTVVPGAQIAPANAAAQADAMGIRYGADTPESLQRSADIINRAKSIPLSSLDPLANVDLQGSAGLAAAGIKTPVTATMGSFDPVTGQYTQGTVTPGDAGLGSLQSKIIPGVATALGAYNTAKAIEAGKEGRAAFSAATTAASAAKLLNIGALGGPVGMLAAAALAAIGASLVNTKEFGDVALRNYWKAVDEGRGIGESNPQELAQGFINFYRTNKNQFAGQEKYGRTGNEDFVYDMTQVINDAVAKGQVDKNVDPATMYQQVVQPWLNTMGEGPKDEDARRIQDFMMTDLIHNFMQGAPISNAQVKGDKNFKIVSEKPVYAGIPPALNRTIGGQPVPNDIARTMYAENNVRQGDLDSWAMSNPVARMQALGQMPAATSPFAEPVEDVVRAQPMPESVPISPLESSPGPGLAGDEGRVIERAMPMPESVPVQEFVGTPYMPEIPSIPISPYRAPEDLIMSTMPVKGFTPELVDEPVYIPREENVPITPEVPIAYGYDPFAGYNYNPFEGFSMTQFAGGGAVGDDFNFGFAQGGIPGEYKAGGRLLNGPGDGMSDDIPAVIRGQGVQRAALADGEFVIPADVVSHLGNGSTNAGAKKLYEMMAKIRQARTGDKKQAPAVKADKYMPA